MASIWMILLPVAIVIAMLSVLRRSWQKKCRRERRRRRGNRHMMYQRLWDGIMVRPKVKRLADLRNPVE